MDEEIDFGIIRDIIDAAEEKYSGAVDCIAILACYKPVLAKNGLDASQDQKYYRFLMKLSSAHRRLNNDSWLKTLQTLAMISELDADIDKINSSRLLKRGFKGLFLNKTARNDDFDIKSTIPRLNFDRINAKNGVFMLDFDKIQAKKPVFQAFRPLPYPERRKESEIKGKEAEIRGKTSENGLNLSDLRTIEPEKNEPLKIKSLFWENEAFFIEKLRKAAGFYKKGLVFKGFFILGALNRVRKEKRRRFDAFEAKKRGEMKKTVFELIAVNAKIKKLSQKRKEKAFSFLSFIKRRFFLSKWLLRLQARQRTVFTLIHNKPALGFLFELILRAKYAENPKKMSLKREKYVDSLRNREKTVNFLSKCLFLPKSKRKTLEGHLDWMYKESVAKCFNAIRENTDKRLAIGLIPLKNLQSKAFKTLRNRAKRHIQIRAGAQHLLYPIIPSKKTFFVKRLAKRQENLRKTLNFLIKRTKRRVFIRIGLQRLKIKRFFKEIATLFEKWRGFAVGRRKNSLRGFFLRNELVLRQKASLLGLWRQKTRNLGFLRVIEGSVERFCGERRRKRTFLAWKQWFCERKRRELGFNRLKNNKITNIFNRIRLLCYNHQEMTAKKVLIERTRQKGQKAFFLMKWLDLTRKSIKSAKFYKKNIKKRVFLAISACFYAKKHQILMFLTQKRRENAFFGLKLALLRRKQHVFLIKKQFFHQENRQTSLKQCFFNGLKANLTENRLITSKIECFYASGLLKRVLFGFKLRNKEKRLENERISLIKGLKRGRILIFWLKQLQNIHRSREMDLLSLKHHQQRLKSLVFSHWLAGSIKKTREKGLIKALNRALRGRVFEKWRHVFEESGLVKAFRGKREKKTKNQVFQAFQQEKERVLSKKTIKRWFLKKLMENSFKRLKKHVDKRQVKEEQLNLVKTAVNLQKTRFFFIKMLEFRLKAQKTKEILSLSLKRHVKRLFSVFFSELKRLDAFREVKSMLLCKFREKKRLKVASRLFETIKEKQVKNQHKRAYREKIAYFCEVKRKARVFNYIRRLAFKMNRDRPFWLQIVEKKRLFLIKNLGRAAEEINFRKKRVLGLFRPIKRLFQLQFIRNLRNYVIFIDKKQVISEKQAFASQFLAKMGFIYSLKRLYAGMATQRKKAYIAGSLHSLHLKREAFRLIKEAFQLNARKQDAKRFRVLMLMKRGFEDWHKYLEERKRLKYMSLLSRSNSSFQWLDQENSLELSNKWFANNSLAGKGDDSNNFSFEK